MCGLSSRISSNASCRSASSVRWRKVGAVFMVDAFNEMDLHHRSMTAPATEPRTTKMHGSSRRATARSAARRDNRPPCALLRPIHPLALLSDSQLQEVTMSGREMPDRANAVPVFRQLYVRYRDAISSGQLKPGDRVPSVRSLASELNLARGTVEAAYQLL